MKKILHVVTNRSHYQSEHKPTGLWLGELTHFYDLFEQKGFEQDIVSPLGGRSPLDPRSFKWPSVDDTILKRRDDKAFMEQLNNTLNPNKVNWEDYDAIYFTGGHGVMWDFPDSAALQEITKNLYENGRIISAVCHGYCGLLNVKLSNGEYLVKGKNLTGFSWREEILSGVHKEIPYNVEKLMKERDARYTKKFLPFRPNVVVDENLITGQNPFSARLTAEKVLERLKEKG